VDSRAAVSAAEVRFGYRTALRHHSGARRPKWLKPAKGQFQIYYKLGTEQPEYIPDFVAETDATIFMVETKARADINTQEVQAKAAAAMRWCKHASDHAANVGTKPWKYLLVPHDEVNESKRLADYLRFEVKA
jgi:type III restriction enzyme